MLKRLVVGLLLGMIIGGVVAAALIQGLNVSNFGPSSTGGALLAYLSAAVTGVLTGLVAGKPIWAADGKIEAGLKAFFGALLAIGGMFALRTWAKLEVDLTALKAGRGLIGELPAVSLPIVAAVLAGFFELDNTGPSSKSDEGGQASSSTKATIPGGKVRVRSDARATEDEELEEAPKKRAR